MRLAIQGILAIVIVGLAYLLYVSITEPYDVIERQAELTDMTRARMDQIRTAMIMHENQYDRFPTTLDSLVLFIRTDSALSLPGRMDSVFGVTGFNPGSLFFSPRTGNRFTLAVNDTSRVKTYLLEDPDTDDFIGTLEPNPGDVNVSSWE